MGRIKNEEAKKSPELPHYFYISYYPRNGSHDIPF
jgi:hypothetical protein